MYALDIQEARTKPKPRLELVWTNPSPETVQRESQPFLVCRSRRHAQNIVRLMDEGYIREVRRGDNLVFCVFEGPEPVVLQLVKTTGRAA